MYKRQSRLSLVQRQKLGVARAVLKRPDLLVIDRATASLDRASHGAILNRVLGEPGRGGVVWVLDDPGEAASFDHVITMEAGENSFAGVAARIGESSANAGTRWRLRGVGGRRIAHPPTVVAGVKEVARAVR